MKVILSEHQKRLLMEYVVPQSMKDRVKRVEDEKTELENYIEKHGEYMTDITNGKTYMVQYLKALSTLVGKGYAMCAPVHSDDTYGAFYVKPYDTFKKLNTSGSANTVRRNRRPNLYQMMQMGNEQ